MPKEIKTSEARPVMKSHEGAHRGPSLTNAKLKANPTQECVVNGEEPT